MFGNSKKRFYAISERNEQTKHKNTFAKNRLQNPVIKSGNGLQKLLFEK